MRSNRADPCRPAPRSATDGNTKQKIRKAADTEDAVARPLTRFRDHPFVKAIGTVAEVGDQPPLVILNLLTVGTGLVLRRPEIVRTGLRMLAAHALATGLKTAIKDNFDRTRPHARIEGKPARAGSGAHDTHDFSSFPSGHTAGAVAVAAAVARDQPAFAGAAYGAAALVAGAQVPRAAHYASDVIAGGFIGWLSERLTSAALDRGEAYFMRLAGSRRPSTGQRLGLPT